MLSITAKWHGAAFDRAVRKQLADNLTAAAHALRDGIRRDIAVQGSQAPPRRSRPGDPPYKQTGELWKSYSVFVDRKALVAQVGTPLEYGRFLELGTLTMAPRPHIRANLYGNILIPLALSQPI